MYSLVGGRLKNLKLEIVWKEAVLSEFDALPRNMTVGT